MPSGVISIELLNIVFDFFRRAQRRRRRRHSLLGTFFYSFLFATFSLLFSFPVSLNPGFSPKLEKEVERGFFSLSYSKELRSSLISEDWRIDWRRLTSKKVGISVCIFRRQSTSILSSIYLNRFRFIFVLFRIFRCKNLRSLGVVELFRTLNLTLIQP